MRFAIAAFENEIGKDFPIEKAEIVRTFREDCLITGYSIDKVNRMADKILSKTSFAKDYVVSQ